MSAMSDYLENEILDHILGTGSWTSPATVYLALYTSNPADDNSGTEVSGGSYAREAIAFDAAASGTCDNTSAIEFTQATANWGTVSHWGIFDASTSGNLLIYGAFSASQAVNSGNIARVAAGEIDITAA